MRMETNMARNRRARVSSWASVLWVGLSAVLMLGTAVRHKEGGPIEETTAVDAPAAEPTHDHAALFRYCFLAVSAMLVSGTMLDLGMERHWNGLLQMIPWFTLGVLGVGIAVFAVRPTVNGIRAARAVGLAAGLSAAYGVFTHVHENLNAGPLDFRYEARWATMSTLAQWWAAATKSVGPSPVLAPGAMLLAAVCLWCATLRHPALNRSEAPSPHPERENGSIASSAAVTSRRRPRAARRANSSAR
jgi:hypothetical protein